LRKKKLFKMGVYAYVALLFAGTSYALFRGVPVEFQGSVSYFDARPPVITTPAALLPPTSPDSDNPILPPPGSGFVTTSPAALAMTSQDWIPGMNGDNINTTR